MDEYTNGEDMEDVRLDNKRDNHWRIVFKDNTRGVDNEKAIAHTKRWDIYMRKIY